VFVLESSVQFLFHLKTENAHIGKWLSEASVANNF